MNNDFASKQIEIKPIRKIEGSAATKQNIIDVKPTNVPKALAFLNISHDHITGASIKMALYKIPNRFQRLMIKWFFGWTVELATEEDTKPQKQLLND